MSRDEFSELTRDLLYDHEHGVLQDSFGRALRRIAGLGVADSFVEREIRRRVQKHKVMRAFQGPFGLSEPGQGEIIRGLDERGRPIRMPLRSLLAHSLTVAGSGAGKTIQALFIALQVALLVPGVWLFDLRKKEYGKLKPYLTRAGIELCVVPARALKLNPLQVPSGVEPIAWASNLSDMLVQVLTLPARASKLLHMAIMRLYDQFGVLRGGREYPTLFDLRELVATDAHANTPAKEAFVDSLDPILMSLGPNVLAYRRAWTTADLCNRHIVFEFCGIPEPAQNLLLNSILWGEFASRIARGSSNVPLSLFVSLDEGARLLSPGATSNALVEMLGLVRGTGIALDLAVQTVDLAPGVLSNTATKCVGRCGSATDYDVIGAAMGLTQDQKQWAKTHLEPGVFIGQFAEGPFRHPFVYRVPRMNLAPPAPTADPAVEATQLPEENHDARRSQG